MVNFKKIARQVFVFYQDRLPRIFLVFLSLWILLVIGAMPYVNLIEGYYFIALGLVWLVAFILFRIKIKISWVVKAGLLSTLVAFPFINVGVQGPAEWFGFIAFFLFFTSVIYRLLRERKDLLG